MSDGNAEERRNCDLVSITFLNTDGISALDKEGVDSRETTRALLSTRFLSVLADINKIKDRISPSYNVYVPNSRRHKPIMKGKPYKKEHPRLSNNRGIALKSWHSDNLSLPRHRLCWIINAT